MAKVLFQTNITVTWFGAVGTKQNAMQRYRSDLYGVKYFIGRCNTNNYYLMQDWKQLNAKQSLSVLLW